jgi:YrbI family 3-deoxy-D-manno-octulosonate 8-phosphate phosphatase
MAMLGRADMKSTDCLCVIPARGGSKGIPGKNLCTVGGIPLVGRSVLAARSSRAITRVVVSTDDPKIAEVARQYGGEVIVRPAELASDSASSESALLHVLEELRQTNAVDPELVCMLQCTSPFTTGPQIDATVQALVSEGADCALTVAPATRFLWRRDADGGAAPVNHDMHTRLRRQEMQPDYVETGAVYVMRREGFVKAGHRFFGTIALNEVPGEYGLEIDSLTDLNAAQLLHSLIDVRSLEEALPRPLQALALDFDGVLTDNRVWVAQDGRESVACSRADGFGLTQVRDSGLPLVVISAERNPVVEERCAKLGIQCMSGVSDKRTVLVAWLAKVGATPETAVFMGNDTADVDCLSMVGCGIAPADAHDSARRAARVVVPAFGGRGAVRLVCEAIMERSGE